MSKQQSGSVAAESVSTDSAATLFAHEIRRDGRVVVTLRVDRTPSGATVESEVFPVTQAVGSAGMTRPFVFNSVEQARRFTDEALVAFEYLNCTVT